VSAPVPEITINTLRWVELREVRDTQEDASTTIMSWFLGAMNTTPKDGIIWDIQEANADGRPLPASIRSPKLSARDPLRSMASEPAPSQLPSLLLLAGEPSPRLSTTTSTA
jgi:hypothetical protein